jgi:hypothetical protein
MASLVRRLGAPVRRRVRRVARLGVAPEHVLDAVGGVEHADQGAPAQAVEGGEEHVLALAVDVVGHLEEGAVVDHSLVERPGVLGETQGRVGADPLREVGGVVARVGDGHRRLLGVEVDRRDVERDVLAHLRDHHPGDAAHLDPRGGREGERHPGRELAGGQLSSSSPTLTGPSRPCGRARSRAAGRAAARPRRNMLGGPSRTVSIRSPSSSTGTRRPPSLKPLRRGPGGEQEEGPLGAEEVGHAHGRELGAVELVRREGDRHPQHGAPDPVLAEQCPERLRLAQQPKLRLGQRDAELAELQEPVDGADPGRGEPRQVGPQVAVEEVEDGVLGRRRTGRERRPGDRRDRGVGGREPVVAAGLGELLEVRQLALGHQAVGDLGLLAVEPYHDQAPDVGLGLPPPADQAPEEAEREDQDRRDRDQDGDEEDQERGEQGEPGPGADVGLGRRGQGEGGGGREGPEPPPGGARAGEALRSCNHGLSGFLVG